GADCLIEAAFRRAEHAVPANSLGDEIGIFVDAVLLQQSWKIFLSILKSDFGSKEAKSLSCVRIKELANSPAQDCANEDVRVENNHFKVGSASCVGAFAWCTLMCTH